MANRKKAALSQCAIGALRLQIPHDADRCLGIQARFNFGGN
jgi:hypothetical protein